VNDRSLEATYLTLWESIGNVIGIALCLATYYVYLDIQLFQLNFYTLPGICQTLISIISIVIVLVKYKQVDYFIQAITKKSLKYKDYSDYQSVTV
jgi:hypothetical protein